MGIKDEFDEFLEQERDLINLQSIIALLEACLPYIQYHHERSININNDHAKLIHRIKEVLGE